MLKDWSNPFVVFPSETLKEQWLGSIRRECNIKGAIDELESLLNNKSNESVIHDYFERFPHFLPSLDHYHNGPRGDLVVSKLPLGNDFITDFAYASENSQAIRFICVEIESPQKKIFNRNGSFTKDYLQARQQIMDWNYWGQQNRREALGAFRSLSRGVEKRGGYFIELQCILIIGRRAEFDTSKKQERWSAELATLPRSLNVMSYDRILTSLRLHEGSWPMSKKMLICNYRDRSLVVKRVCP